MAALCVVGGGACAAWGVHDTAAWISSLHRGDGVITTESVILGLPLLGSSVCAIGPLFIFPQPQAVRPGGRPSKPSDRMTVAVLAVLGSMLAGIVLMPLGGLAIKLVMMFEGYHACDVHGRGRVTVVTWARAEESCPAP